MPILEAYLQCNHRQRLSSEVGSQKCVPDRHDLRFHHTSDPVSDNTTWITISGNFAPNNFSESTAVATSRNSCSTLFDEASPKKKWSLRAFAFRTYLQSSSLHCYRTKIAVSSRLRLFATFRSFHLLESCPSPPDLMMTGNDETQLP